jgi:hypothetical protein
MRDDSIAALRTRRSVIPSEMAMRNLLITVIAIGFFATGVHCHDVSYNPQPMVLTYGGQDGTISVVLVGTSRHRIVK